MLSVATIITTIGATVLVPVVQTDGAGGIQFDLTYDPATLELLNVIVGPAVTGDVTPPSDPVAGSYRFLLSSVEAQPEHIVSFEFRVNGPSVITLEGVVMGTPLGQPINAEITNGAIEIEETEMKSPTTSGG